MIVTAGRHIRIDLLRGFTVERTCETPGAITLRKGVQTMEVYASEVEDLCEAMRRALAEPIEYRTMVNE